MKKVGFVGWRGMVGSVLIDRMKEECDFNNFYSIFLSTSQVGDQAPNIIKDRQNLILQDAWNIEILNSLDIIVTCQGSTYSKVIYSKLRRIGWTGYWIDSASFLRMNDDAIIVLDPVNQKVIEQGINNGIRTFVGGNCTVSLMLMALGGLFNQDLVDWISVSTYQAASGYGARAMIELFMQMGQSYNIVSDLLKNPNISILDIERIFTEFCKTDAVLIECFKKPLIGNLIPWIGSEEIMSLGQTQEEWKGQLETNKILNTVKLIPVDSICVRVCSFRCHSQSIVLKLKKNICLSEIEYLIKSHNIWIELVPNNLKSSLERLTPLAISGKLKIAIGRLHKMNIGSEFISAFTVGDQLLWGAAEPLRRILLQLL